MEIATNSSGIVSLLLAISVNKVMVDIVPAPAVKGNAIGTIAADTYLEYSTEDSSNC